MTEPDYKQYRRTQIAELADWTPDFDMTDVSISFPDNQAGSPKLGDKIARNPANHNDRWLVCAAYFDANFEPAALAHLYGEQKDRAQQEIERLRNLLAECFPLVRPGIDLSRRLREALD